VLKTFCNVTTIIELSKLFERLVWDGGIHSGHPEEKEKYLSILDKKADTDEELTFKAIRAICNVALKSMKRLKSDLDARASTGGL
jgi:hypothetical protein